ncbi:hypothetical protein Tco_1266885, partial [Tanacetum coccineum]
IMEMDPYIENMTLNEYLEYEAENERRLWDNFFAQPPKTPNTLVDKKDSDFDEILDDLFSIGAKNLRRMGQEKVHHGCNDVDLEKDKAEVEDDDDGDTYVIWKLRSRTMRNYELVEEMTRRLDMCGDVQVYAFGISLSYSYTGDAHDVVLGY